MFGRGVVPPHIGQLHSSATVYHGPVDSYRAAVHQEQAATVKHELLRYWAIWCVVRIEGAQESEGAWAQPVKLLAVCDDLLTDHQPELSMRTEIPLGLIRQQPLLR